MMPSLTSAAQTPGLRIAGTVGDYADHFRTTLPGSDTLRGVFYRINLLLEQHA